jgi:uncharacterized protein (TIGR02246 family)
MTPRRDGPGGGFGRAAKTNGFAPNGHIPLHLIAAYADQELEPGPAFEVERHVDECTACLDSLRLQRAVGERLRQQSSADVPVALRDRVFAAVRAAPPPRDARARVRAEGPRNLRSAIGHLVRHPAWAAAAVVALALLAYPRDRTPVGRVPAVNAASDSAAILSLIQAHAAAWNNRDARAAASLLTADAVWVTSAGVELHGREAIERAHVEWLALDSAAGGTRHVHPPGAIAVRFLRADIAVVDAVGQFVAPTAAGAQGTVLEQARIFVVATRDGDGWRIAQLRNLRRQGVGPTPR